MHILCNISGYSASYVYAYIHVIHCKCMHIYTCIMCASYMHMGWLRLVSSLKLQVSFAKEPYKRDDILQKRPIILRSLLIVETPYAYMYVQYMCIIYAYTYNTFYPRILIYI